MKYLSEWRNEINKYISIHSLKYIDTKFKILDIGPENSTSTLIKNLFINYSSLDKRKELNPTYNFNLCKTEEIEENKLTNYFDLIYCLEVLEHIEEPWIAARNLISMLKDNGILFISVPSFLEWHPHGDREDGLYGDYWRFLPGHIKYLFPNIKMIDSYTCKYDNIMLGMLYILQKEI